MNNHLPEQPPIMPVSEPVATTVESGVAPDGSLPDAAPVREIGGRRDGPEPTRYGDWEKSGRCIDF